MTVYNHAAKPVQYDDDPPECSVCGVRTVGDLHIDEGPDAPTLPMETPDPIPRTRPIPVPVSGDLDPVTTTLDDAQQWVREHAEGNGGTKCPACGQHAQVYRWSLYARAARALVLLHRAGGTTEFVHSRDITPPGAGGSPHHALAWWGLAEQEKKRRPDGGRSGYWCCTEEGKAFLRGAATIPKYVYVYDGHVLRHDGPQVSIHDALGEQFNYDEHMAGV